MKRRLEWGVVVFTVCFIFILRFGFLEGPAQVAYLDILHRSTGKNQSAFGWLHGNVPHVVGYENFTNANFHPSEHMPDELRSSAKSILGSWGGLKRILNRSDLPREVQESFREGLLAWEGLIPFVDDEGHANTNGDKLCPKSAILSNVTDHVLALPCGLVLDSSITVIATPLFGSTDFRIELIGANFPGENGQPPVILHYNVRIQGDLLTDKAVIIQNTWTSRYDWGAEERCPSPVELNPSQVDGLDRCVQQVGATLERMPPPGKDSTASNWPNRNPESSNAKPWFPFMEGMPFAATIWAGWDGFHVTINGKHISSFQYRQGHEPSLIGSVDVRGDLQLASIFATGLPVSENMTGAEYMKTPQLPPKAKMILFIGIFSSSSNFDQRMAQRKSWMQYEAVRSQDVVVRFFVGLHAQEQVNKELWEEAKTFGDLQLLPFVDHYHLITLKTAAICTYVTQNLRADYVMKTDDDTFVRVDEVLSLIRGRDSDQSFLMGDVTAYSEPFRDPSSKWYISMEEWPDQSYPPFAHGPGYVFSSDIASFVSRHSSTSRLKLFKLEDVCMGIWIDEFKSSENRHVDYVHNPRFISGGCEDGYITAHYQTPRQMLCLWNQLQRTQRAVCC